KNTKYFHKFNNNLLEAVHSTILIKKIFGASIYEFETKNGRTELRFTLLGFGFFMFWYLIFYYSAYITFREDQSILRTLYDTKLKQYGDHYERVSTIIFAVYVMWKLPFSLNRSPKFVQQIAHIDKAISSLGEVVDYRDDAFAAYYSAIFQMAVFFARTLCIWVTIGDFDMEVPYESIYQMVFADSTALVISGQFCYFTTVLKRRYTITNRVLDEIRMQKSWEYILFVRDKPMKTERSLVLQDKYLCQKIQTCAKIYSMLYKAIQQFNGIFGLIILVILYVGNVNVVLYLFYFMEATASGLFHDLQRYMYFLVGVFWRSAYAVGIGFIIVYYTQKTVQEAAEATYITHEIVNSNLSPTITKEAMQLSLQMLHQVPIFTVRGLFKLDYELMHHGIRSVVTFLVILLQFVMDT
ncbi:putative gustatory receptor 28a, partial [Ostrinia furnacalis]|uniref:putative gustatory receptor 28a n=1 Tax=Ostrinia furnacalis TaxID=93504 RepID=UPI00103F5070